MFAAANAAGNATGILAPAEADARRYLEMGIRFVGVGSDLGVLRMQSQALCDKYRESVGCPDRRTILNLEPRQHIAMTTNTSPLKLGFIGLGIMGAPMAGHLLAAGHSLFVKTRSKVPAALLEAGGKECDSPRQVAESADIVFLMLPDTPDVAKVLFADDGVAAGLVQGQARGRHEQHLADGDAGLRETHCRARLRLCRCPGQWRRSGRQGRPA